MSENYRLYGSLTILMGCADAHFGADYASDTSVAPAESGGNLDSSGYGDTVDAAWWNLSANLLFENGEISIDDSSFSAEILEDDRHAICTMAGRPVSAVLDEENPHETIDHWWSFTLEQWDASCDGLVSTDSMPTEFQLGLGQMHPEILAVLDNLAQAESGSEAMLSSSFASFDAGESLLVFGVGGTSSDFAGIDDDGKDGEDFSGAYTIYPLYPFEFPTN